MSELSLDTLKTMLANLDDAKKYQSLRDVMETLPAPDLAAVFEDLPAEKLPVLFRLCPKDLAADVFTELTPATQQKLIDGLTDTELRTWWTSCAWTMRPTLWRRCRPMWSSAF